MKLNWGPPSNTSVPYPYYQRCSRVLWGDLDYVPWGEEALASQTAVRLSVWRFYIRSLDQFELSTNSWDVIDGARNTCWRKSRATMQRYNFIHYFTFIYLLFHSRSTDADLHYIYCYSSWKSVRGRGCKMNKNLCTFTSTYINLLLEIYFIS